MDRLVVKTPEWAHFIGNKIFKNEWRAIILPSKPIIPQNISHPNFKKRVLFSLIERSSNYVFGDVNFPTVLRTRAVS
jgi:hypothetical protein